MYKIKYEKKAKKFLKNLDFSMKNRIDNELEKLKFKPFPKNKKHILDTSQISLLCELSIDKLRIYYTIEDGFIVIEEIINKKIKKIEYEGIVTLIEGQNNHKSGNKKNYPNQRRDIKRIKQWFQNLFKNK